MTYEPEPDRPAHHRLAGWWPRVGATALDGLIVWAIAVAAAVPATIGEDLLDLPGDGALWAVLAVILAAVYACALLSRKGAHNGQTLGKQAVGIRVVRDDGTPVTAGHAFVREVLLKYGAGNLLLGMGWIVDSLWPLGERENRALHDLLVHTHVVETRPSSARPGLPEPGVAQPQFAPEIARHVQDAQRIELAIREAVQRAQLPYTGVSTEVGSLVGLLRDSGRRAQLLHEALADTPVATVERRLAELDGSGKAELIGALEEQLAGRRRMRQQLDRSLDEMERVVAELDTVRSSLLSVSASTDVAGQQRLADQVRGLRDEMAAVAEGADQAYGPR